MTKVLLVEDDLIVQRVHELMLTKLECEVDIAESGTRALELAQTTPYHIIFVDIGLPDIPGFELIKKLRECLTTYLNEIPIIALTGYAGHEEKVACYEAGATEIIYKPIVSNTLRNLLAQYHLSNKVSTTSSATL